MDVERGCKALMIKLKERESNIIPLVSISVKTQIITFFELDNGGRLFSLICANMTTSSIKLLLYASNIPP